MATKTSSSNKPYKCEYCGNSYARERTLQVHMCTQKRREMQKNEKRVQMGFYAFNEFYRLSVGLKKNKTYEEFRKSPYYNAFVKFGSFITNVNPLYPEKFIRHAVTSGVKIEKWATDEFYNNYVTKLIKEEGVETALERSISTITNWAEEKQECWNEYFKRASYNRIIWNIKDGKVSPWLVLNSKSGRDMLSSLDNEHLQMIQNNVMDPTFWQTKFKQQPSDVRWAKQIIKQAGL